MTDSGNDEVVDDSVGGTIREAMAELEMDSGDLGFDTEFAAPIEDEEISNQGDDDSSEPEPVTQEEETDEVLVAPRSWSAEEKEAFSSFPAEAKKALIRRQADMDRHYHTRSQEIAEREKQISDIEQHLAPYKDEMARDGVSPQVLAQMYKWHKYLSDPKTAANGIRELSTRYGVNPASIAQSANSNPNPAVAKVESKVTELETTLKQQQEAAEQRRQLEYQQAAAAEVSAFRNEVDTSGAKKYPLIGEGEALEQPMAQELRIINQIDPELPLRDKLEQAYKRAVALNPDIKSELDAKANRASQAAKVKKARIAGSSVVGSPSSTPVPQQQERSLREELLFNWKQLSNS